MAAAASLATYINFSHQIVFCAPAFVLGSPAQRAAVLAQTKRTSPPARTLPALCPRPLARRGDVSGVVNVSPPRNMAASIRARSLRHLRIRGNLDGLGLWQSGLGLERKLWGCGGFSMAGGEAAQAPPGLCLVGISRVGESA